MVSVEDKSGSKGRPGAGAALRPRQTAGDPGPPQGAAEVSTRRCTWRLQRFLKAA